jgi:hypothetical protein
LTAIPAIRRAKRAKMGWRVEKQGFWPVFLSRIVLIPGRNEILPGRNGRFPGRILTLPGGMGLLPGRSWPGGSGGAHLNTTTAFSLRDAAGARTVLSRSSTDRASSPRCSESHSLTHVLRLKTAALRQWYQAQDRAFSTFTVAFGAEAVIVPTSKSTPKL